MALNHYLLLGIPSDADQQRIKTVYRRLAKRFHPDANKGSEAATELFRQINHAYRTLSDSKLRLNYDQELAKQEAASRGREATKASDPQQKFNHFVNSLLDALFDPIDDGVKQTAKPRLDSRVKKNGKIRSKPAFNFYYHLAMEKNSTAYICGDDGIYRKASAKNFNEEEKTNLSEFS